MIKEMKLKARNDLLACYYFFEKYRISKFGNTNFKFSQSQLNIFAANQNKKDHFVISSVMISSW